MLALPSATAQKRPSSGDQQIDVHEIADAPVLNVQVIPSGEVWMLVLPDTAQKMPSSGDQQIDIQEEEDAPVLKVQFIPSVEV
jgi:hypothetical protein